MPARPDTGRRVRTWVNRILMLAILAWLVPAWAQQTRIVDRIEVDESGGKTRIRLDFNVPLQYINHAPQDHGDKLILQLRPVVAAQTEDIDFTQPESLTWESGPGVPLQFVRYEGGTAQRVQLGIYFVREIDYEVQPGTDARSLSILLARPETPPAPALPRAPEPGPAADTAARPDIRGRYVLNLESSVEARPLPPASAFDLAAPAVLYRLQSPVNGRVWNRLRLGFFETKAAAQAAQARLQAAFPRTWIAVAPEAERREALETGTVIGAGAARPPAPAPQPLLPALPQERLDALMEEARQAMAGADYARAIRLYTKVLQHADTGGHQDAQEFLGLARERNRQIAHAKAAYEEYLARYPEGPGAERVRQRLAGLLTARKAPKERLRAAERGKEEPAWDVFGSFSQYYRRDTSHIVEQDTLTDRRTEETRVNLSSLSSDLDITGRRRGGPLEIQMRFTGGYEKDFLDEDEGRGDISRVSSLYADVQHRDLGLGARFGRQTRSSGGVLGRFDGAFLSYQWKPTVRLNAVSGYPVDSSRDAPDTERYFYGVSADFGTYANTWDFVAFLIEQQMEDMLDRRAVGGEIRYFDPVKSLLTYVDYDVSYNQLNTLLLLGNLTLPYQVTLNATVDIRQSPILTTRNALQGQPVTTLEELRASFSDDEIRRLAEDRTADSRSYTVGLSRPFGERFQLSGDVTVSNYGSTPASAGVEALPGTGDEFFYNLQLIGSNLLKEGDIGILGLRYSDTSTSDTVSLSLNERYPINRVWRINPRVRLDYRQYESTDTDRWTGAPSVLVDYLWRKRYRFEFETGGEWSTRELVDGSEDSVNWFVYLGYRADF